MTTLAPPQPPLTRSGLLPDARHVVLPAGIVASGFPAVKATCEKIGIRFDPWQEDLNRCILAKDQWKLYAADTVVLSVCRQAGKTYDVGAIAFALCIIHPGSTVVWTAHRFKVARETFNELRALAKSSLLAPHIDYEAITTAAGNECIPFRNGSRIVFAARERGAVRGFTKVRILILDEAQILTEAAMADLVPTTNQAENPLVILMGTPPKPTDPGEVFTALRTAALAGDSEGVLYVEFAAPPDCDSDDWEAVEAANPSFPKRTGKRAILRLRKLLTNDEDYRREGLGIWDDDQMNWIVPRKVWLRQRRWDDEAGKATSRVKGQPVFAVEVSKDRSAAWIAAAGVASNGGLQFELVDHRPGTAWLVDAAKKLKKKHRGDVFVIDAASEAAGLAPELDEAGLRVIMTNARQMVQACGYWYDDLIEGRAVHLGQREVDAALAGAVWRELEASRALGRKKSSVDIAPLVACVLAVWGHHEHGDYNVTDSFW